MVKNNIRVEIFFFETFIRIKVYNTYTSRTKSIVNIVLTASIIERMNFQSMGHKTVNF